MDLANPGVLKMLMAQHGLRPQHRLGQNFLIDGRVLDGIVAAAELQSDDLVLEIGPGLGTLTQRLAAKAGHVVCIELERGLVQVLQDTVQKACANVEVIHGDAGRVDLHKLLKERLAPGRKAKVVANLPYYITTPLVMRLLEERLPLERVVVMVQKEVADRMVAMPGGKDYGSLSVAVQYYSKARKMFDVPPHCFIPQPDVYSSVIRLDVNKEPPVKVKDRAAFFKTVKAAFGQRRKTLLNALCNSGSFSKDKEQIGEILKNMGLDENQRGETLTIEQFAELSNLLL